MKLIQWNNDFLTGVKEVDEQHQGLVGLVNQVAPKLAALGDRQVEDFASIFQELGAYTDTHFKTEEDLMRRCGVDARVLDRHRKAHAGLVQVVTGLTRRVCNGDHIAGDEVLSFLAGWLINHMLGEDQSMARQIHAIEGGLSPDRAYREAGGYRTSPSEEVLPQVLINLYKQLIHSAGR
jgi:hemerythrin-like metal-binding protein